jgi:ABC-type transporter Mla subunit MlaD
MMVGSTRRPPIASATATIVIALLMVGLSGCSALGGGGAGHHVYINVSDGESIVPGQDVRIAGSVVGTVSSVAPLARGRAVRIGLTIDAQAWPLRRGTTVDLRWGGTVSFLNRYIAIQMGPGGAAPIADNATIPARQVAIPTEFDQLIGTFDRPTRRSLKAFLDNAGAALWASRAPLRSSLQVAPAAVGNASAALSDLHASDADLSTLVGSTANVVAALHQANPGLGRLIADTGTTLNATARASTALQSTLGELPRTLTQTDTTAAMATATLTAADRLLARLAPGVAQLQQLPDPLNQLLSSLISIGPDATATLSTAARDTPAITQFVNRTTVVMPTVDGVAQQATTSLSCIRPYTPEIAAFFSNWGDFISQVDQKDHLIRANIQQLLPAPTPIEPYNSATAVKMFPGLRYAFPRPPGYDAGQPWFLPQCHAGPSALNPAADPEARPFPASHGTAGP